MNRNKKTEKYKSQDIINGGSCGIYHERAQYSYMQHIEVNKAQTVHYRTVFLKYLLVPTELTFSSEDKSHPTKWNVSCSQAMKLSSLAQNLSMHQDLASWGRLESVPRHPHSAWKETNHPRRANESSK